MTTKEYKDFLEYELEILSNTLELLQDLDGKYTDESFAPVIDALRNSYVRFHANNRNAKTECVLLKLESCLFNLHYANREAFYNSAYRELFYACEHIYDLIVNTRGAA